MLNFYPGPSKIYPRIKEFAAEAFASVILEKNHRSDDFMQLLKDCKSLLKNHLNIPDNYEVYFTSSATESWEVCIQSLFKGKIQFFYNGAFGKKWFKYAVTNAQINASLQFAIPEIRGTRFFVNQKIEEAETDPENDIICCVANETSNGTQISNESLSILKTNSPHALLFIDATSSLGGFNHNISLADVWLASSQKCFGLPSGLGFLILSPRAIEKAKEINERNHYNSLVFIKENFDKNQTHYTPNILGIYLLKRNLEYLENIHAISNHLEERAGKIYSFFETRSDFEILVENPETRSDTVIAVKPKSVSKLMSYLFDNNIVIGKGYGEWKRDSVRIANFPAIPDEDFETLFKVLANFS
ncbi:alanine--glyoxylate aminotransferase family protein [Lacihabitans sp. LS3-19]|uniref:aminotransferase class V-fold PLP-dependent enzyme n=1 Tax=Lacihabitans sp. LS3-19 TaxID=2487335 RepID=UPI0020CEFF07|nr:aminotransferase class V-fold PLP-dependent enzyme [Lacihabitans sp. LS3-19]MCP9767701.1 alanine--glyoxylate aminotransferase family protein [Lacihabitans sp. LS3-19]